MKVASISITAVTVMLKMIVLFLPRCLHRELAKKAEMASPRELAVNIILASLTDSESCCLIFGIKEGIIALVPPAQSQVNQRMSSATIEGFIFTL